MQFVETLAAQQAKKMAKKEVMHDELTKCLVDTQMHLNAALAEITQLKVQVNEQFVNIKALRDKNQQLADERVKLIEEMQAKAAMLLKA